MKYCAVALVLLGSFVLAQAKGSTVVIEDSDDLNSNKQAKAAFCGIVGVCHANEKAQLNAYQAQLASLKQQVSQLQSHLTAHGYDTPAHRYNDYKPIADLKPVFWLSGSYFDGFKANASFSRTGLAGTTDVLGNAVTKVGNVRVAKNHGSLAYIFDKSNSITSVASVSNKFTFAVVYRFPAVPAGIEGRFFTSPDGNKLFAGWAGYTQQLYIEDWINNNAVKTTDTVILIGTNDNGIKNLWTHDNQLVANSRTGTNAWGKVVVGRPVPFSNEAASVNVYEAIAFDKVLDNAQREKLLSVLKKYYGRGL